MHQTFEKFNEFRRNTLSFIIISPPGNALIFPGERGGRILKFPGDPRTGDPRGQALFTRMHCFQKETEEIEIQ